MALGFPEGRSADRALPAIGFMWRRAAPLPLNQCANMVVRKIAGVRLVTSGTSQARLSDGVIWAYAGPAACMICPISIALLDGISWRDIAS
jgi:hypothetical protein